MSKANLVAEIQWLQPPPATTSSCVCCGNSVENVIVLRATPVIDTFAPQDFAVCGMCGSAFNVVPAPIVYRTEASELDTFEFKTLQYHYVELINGLHWKIPLLNRLPWENINSVLEVGCSWGIALDYCKTIWDVKVLGLEPSAAGVAGCNLFNIDIRHQYLAEANELGGKKFDFIYATEVIEHIRQPREFLTAVADALTPDGVVMITTPRAEDVNQNTPHDVLVMTVSAVAHEFIASEYALRKMLFEAGFIHQLPQIAGNSAVMYCSRKRFDLKPEPRCVDESLRDYYLAKRAFEEIDPRLRLSFAIDAFDACTRLEEPNLELGKEIDAELEQQFGISIHRPFELEQKLAMTYDIFSFGEAVPFGLPKYIRAFAPHAEEGTTMDALYQAVLAHGMRVNILDFAVYAFWYRESYRRIHEGFLTQEGAELLRRADLVAAGAAV